MAKLECCNLCKYCAHSPYLVCAEHPGGVEGNSCKDFRLAIRERPSSDAPLAWSGEGWQPEGASYYGGELILDPVRVRSLDEQVQLLDSHPLFTGGAHSARGALKRSLAKSITTVRIAVG